MLLFGFVEGFFGLAIIFDVKLSFLREAGMLADQMFHQLVLAIVLDRTKLARVGPIREWLMNLPFEIKEDKTKMERTYLSPV